jgi:hypothetical protein
LGSGVGCCRWGCCSGTVGCCIPDHAIRSDENIGDDVSCAAERQASKAIVPTSEIDQRNIYDSCWPFDVQIRFQV